MSFRRIAGISGLVFVVLLAIALALDTAPAPGDSIEDVVEYYQDDPGLIELLLVLGTAATLVFPVWLVGIVGRLRGRDEPWAIVGLVGGILTLALASVQEISSSALVLRQEALGSDLTTQVLWDLNNLGFASTTVAGVVLLGGLAIAALRTGQLPAWLGWLAGLGALAGAVGAVSIVDFASGNSIAFVSFGWFIIFLVFVLITSVLMIQSDAPAGQVEDRTAAPAA